jgi:hypothetical protein
MIFNLEFRELIRAAHRPSRPPRAQRRSLDQDDGRDGITTGDGEPADPDDVIDPDDLRGGDPLGWPALLPPPTQSEALWAVIVLGREKDAVAPQDALLALAHVAYRLGYARADMGKPHHGVATVGQLHEAIEEMFGSAGWTALVECWQEAAGIKQPERKATRSRADITDRIPARPKDHGVLSAEPLVPLPPDSLPDGNRLTPSVAGDAGESRRFPASCAARSARLALSGDGR